MFMKKVSTLLALGLCATSAAANYLKTVDATDYVQQTYTTANAKPLVVKPNTVYVVDKSYDIAENDESLVLQCPKVAKSGTKAPQKGFLFYVAMYYGFDESGLDLYQAGRETPYLTTIYSAFGEGSGYASMAQFFCDGNGNIATSTYG